MFYNHKFLLLYFYQNCRSFSDSSNLAASTSIDTVMCELHTQKDRKLPFLSLMNTWGKALATQDIFIVESH